MQVTLLSVPQQQLSQQNLDPLIITKASLACKVESTDITSMKRGLYVNVILPAIRYMGWFSCFFLSLRVFSDLHDYMRRPLDARLLLAIRTPLRWTIVQIVPV